MVKTFRKLKMKELNRPDLTALDKIRKMPVIVVLDNLRSLHNVGSIFRTGDAFLVEAIWLCGITARPPHREIHKTALGATESVAWRYFETAEEVIRELRSLKARLIIAEQTENSTLPNSFSAKGSETLAVVFGNEVEGVNDAFAQAADTVLEIPQFGTKHSLNVAVAAGIILWEIRKKMV